MPGNHLFGSFNPEKFEKMIPQHAGGRGGALMPANHFFGNFSSDEKLEPEPYARESPFQQLQP